MNWSLHFSRLNLMFDMATQSVVAPPNSTDARRVDATLTPTLLLLRTVEDDDDSDASLVRTAITNFGHFKNSAKNRSNCPS